MSCSNYQAIPESTVNQVIDQWHKAAANADFDTYINLMTTDAVFIGTDATENWQLAEFKRFAKPYFDRGKAWSFTSIERNIYTANGVVYFDELLSTQMGICRGSGILKKENGSYRIAHYVLSIAVPNENVESLTEMKKKWDAEQIDKRQRAN
jgi:ketosteroid isomerase-like protein